MFDALFSILDLSWLHLGEDTSKNILTGKEEKWLNSKYDVVFGDSFTSILGLGRQTAVFGPDIKSIIDWTTLLELIVHPESKKGKFVAESFLGQGGSTDFILGNKNLINYGIEDITITRKKHAPIKIDLIGDVNQHVEGWWNVLYSQRLLVILYVSFQMAFPIITRCFYMGRGLDTTDHHKAEKTIEILMECHKNIGIRILGLLKLVEKLYFVNDSIEARKHEMEGHAQEGEGLIREQVEHVQEVALNPQPPEAVEQRYRDYVAQQLRGQIAQLNQQVTQTAKEALWDLGYLVPDISQVDNRARDFSNKPQEWQSAGQLTWKSAGHFTHIVNPSIYGDDKQKKAAPPQSQSLLNQSVSEFRFNVKYENDTRELVNHELVLNNNGFIVSNPQENAVICLKSGKTDDAKHSALRMTDGSITIGCGQSNNIFPSINMDSSDQYVSISQGGIPNLKAPDPNSRIPGRALILDANVAGLYGGIKTNDVETAGYIELKGANSIVIKLLGSKITMDSNGIVLQSDKKITIDSDTGIELKKGEAAINITNDVLISSMESQIRVLAEGFRNESATLKSEMEATVKQVAALFQTDISGLKEDIASLVKQGK